jgi:Post-segregation antitoxin CcdA
MNSLGLYMATYGTHVCMNMEILEHNREPKQKLTLGLNKDIIERAKAAAINISVMTEELLTALTYEPNMGNDFYDVVAAYQTLFDAIGHKIMAYNTSALEVGTTHNKLTGPAGSPIFFHPHGGFVYNTEDGGYGEYRLEETIGHLYPPSKILSNLVTDLIEAAEANKEKIKELEMALRFVKVLATDGDSINNEPRKQ